MLSVRRLTKRYGTQLAVAGVDFEVEPGEIGALTRYLCSDEAMGITMQDLTVSAGSLW